MRSIFILVSCVLAISVGGCGGGEPTTNLPPDAGSGIPAECTGASAATLDVAYQALPDVEAVLQRLDIYPTARAASCPLAPVVVWIHGGAWAIGDKAQQIEDKQRWFNERGYLLGSVNYRLSPASGSTLDPARVKHPDHARDVAAAIAWVHTNIDEYGGDPSRIALLGHSAGAHLVALVATDESFLDEHGIALAQIACVGSFDTEAYDIQRTLKSASKNQALILLNAFGDDPEVQAAASPMSHVVADQGIPDFLVAQRGDADRRAVQGDFHLRLLDRGIASTLIDASSLSHAEVNERIGLPGDDVMTPPLAAFLTSCW